MTIGIIGVGHLAAAILAGLRGSGLAPAEVLLAPRGQGPALAQAHGHGLARSNADLVRACDIVLLAVRPKDAAEAIRGLPWRAGQVLLSACAGVPLAALSAAAPARTARIMPITAAEIGRSPTVLFPDLAAAKPLLARIGPVIAVPSEADFETATVSAAVYGWVQALVQRTAQWSAAQGLPPDAARALVAHTFAAAGQLIAEKPAPMADLLLALITPGGITERGLDVLRAQGVPEAWDAACDAVLARLRG